MAFTALAIQGMLVGRGQTVTLRRIGAGAPADLDCLGKIDGDADQAFASNVAQYGRRVIISNAEIAAAGWPGPPRRNDQIIANGATMAVQGVDTATIGASDVMHVMKVLGG